MNQVSEGRNEDRKANLDNQDQIPSLDTSISPDVTEVTTSLIKELGYNLTANQAKKALLRELCNELVKSYGEDDLRILHQYNHYTFNPTTINNELAEDYCRSVMFKLYTGFKEVASMKKVPFKVEKPGIFYGTRWVTRYKEDEVLEKVHTYEHLFDFDTSCGDGVSITIKSPSKMAPILKELKPFIGRLSAHSRINVHFAIDSTADIDVKSLVGA